MKAYRSLEAIFAKIYRLKHMVCLADWDFNTTMPPKGAEARSAALAEMEVLLHERITDTKVKQLLENVQTSVQDLDSLQQANFREMYHVWKVENMLSGDFVERRSLLITAAQPIWRKCREENDFAGFLPTLRSLVDLFREEGRQRAGASGKHPYEALVDIYEPGMTLQRIDEIFSNVKSWLPALIREVQEKQKAIKDSVIEPKGPFPIAKQEELGRLCMGVWKFDFEAGRLDVSAHPFCGNVKEDVRITTNYREEDFDKSLFGIIHETGHAKYEQNCGPKSMREQPVASARSLGVHEGQSLFAEMQIARSSAFMEFLSPKLRECFGDQPAFTADNMKKVSQAVEPGHIRIYADELCYPMHVILRYEMERDLIDGKIEADDVPRVWNEKMKSYLGLETAGNDKLGCLQDTHWASGLFGYFPTYTLGAMIAAQVMASIRKELGDEVVNDCIRKGELEPLLNKQNEKIWQHGSSMTTEDLIKQATGEILNPDHYRRHLERRYRDGAN